LEMEDAEQGLIEKIHNKLIEGPQKS
jgi:hypothetical protein